MEQARDRAPRRVAQLGDAHDLDVEASTFDAVLLLGPLATLWSAGTDSRR